MDDQGTSTRESEGPRTEIEARLRIETLIAELSTKFINLPSCEVDCEIEGAQRRICECLDLDVSTLWQWSAQDPANFILTHLYRRFAGPAIPERMAANLHFPWTLERMLSGKTVLFTSLDELPPEAAAEREIRRRLGIVSSATFPLIVAGKDALGTVTFNASRKQRTWPEPLVKQLRLIAQIFASALDRKRSDQLLLAGEQRLALAAKSAGAGLWSLDFASGTIWATDKTYELFGWQPDDDLDLDRYMASVHPEDQDTVRQTIQNLADKVSEGAVDYRIRRPDGQVRWIASRGRSFRGDTERPDRLMGVSMDATERKTIEDTLHELTGRLIAAHEDERARLSRELHDDVTQRLACLAIDIAGIEPRDAADSIAAGLSRVKGEIVRLSEDVHTLAYQLHPSILEDLGLIEALRTECERFTARESVPVDMSMCEITEPVPGDAAICLYRVVQEALRNIVRHAAAEGVKVSVRETNGGLQVAVSDDGVGFDLVASSGQRTLGLTGMRERVRLLGGVFNVESGPGRGTTVEAWVPLRRDDRES